MFFDFLYFKPNDNIMTVEPAMLLMVRYSYYCFDLVDNANSNFNCVRR